MSTTRTDARERRRRRNWPAATAGAAIGCALLWCAAPVVAGAAAAAAGNDAARGLRARVDLAPRQRLALVTSRSDALNRYGVLEWRRELATASLLPAEGAGRADAQALERATDQTRLVLERAPASARDWLRLAQLDALAGHRDKAVAHLSTALLTGADRPRLRIGLVGLGFDLWGELPLDARRAVLAAMQHEWRARGDREGLIVRAKATGLMPVAGLMLRDEPDYAYVVRKLQRQEDRK